MVGAVAGEHADGRALDLGELLRGKAVGGVADVGDHEAEQVGVEPDAFLDIGEVVAEMAEAADAERTLELDAADGELAVPGGACIQVVESGVAHRSSLAFPWPLGPLCADRPRWNAA